MKGSREASREPVLLPQKKCGRRSKVAGLMTGDDIYRRYSSCVSSGVVVAVQMREHSRDASRRQLESTATRLNSRTRCQSR